MFFIDAKYLIMKYGYLALFLGSMVEGESIVMGISSMCYSGMFTLWKVMILAFVGTLIADQACFFVGRFFGRKLFSRYPDLVERSNRIFHLIEKYDAQFILTFRFIYGIRILSPFVIGASKIPSQKFAILNIIASALWSLAICGAGYFVGYVGDTFLGGTSMLFVLAFNTSITLSVIYLAHYFSKDIR